MRMRRPTAPLAALAAVLVGVALPLVAGAPARAADPVIAIAGDVAGSGGQQRMTGDLIRADPSIQRVLVPGDIAYENGTLAEFNTHYDPAWGSFKAKTDPVPGNHEYNSGGGGYFQYFGSRATPPGHSNGSYAYDLGTWRIIALNEYAGDPLTFLKNDLAANPRQCTLAYWHEPVFSGSARKSGNKKYWDALYAAGGDVIVNGHNHVYERFRPQNPSGAIDTSKGIVQFVAGTGGMSGGRIATGGNVASAFKGRGILKMTLRAGSYSWQFVGSGGSDSGSANCVGGGGGGGTLPTATFTGAPTTGSAPLAVSFHDASSGSPTAWAWNFGDGTTSTQQHPTHTYTSPGTYTVRLTVTNATGSDEQIRTGYITVGTSGGGGETPGPTFTPVADSYVRSGTPTENNGTKTNLRVRGGGLVTTYLKFDVSGLTGPVTGARLRLAVQEGGVDGGTVRDVGDASWTETGITHQNAPAPGTALAAPVGPVGTGGTVDVDLGAGAVAGDGTVSFAITGNSDDTVDYLSRQSGTPPQLILTQGSGGGATTTTTSTTTPGATTTTTSTTTTSTPPGGGGTGTFAPDADTYVRSGAPTEVNGSRANLRVRGPATESRAFLRFSVTGLSGTVQSVRLRLKVLDPSPAGGIVRRVASNTWDEATTSWNTQPALGTVVGSPIGAAADETFVEIDVTAYVTGNGTWSFAITDASASDYVDYYSSESAAPPQLVVTTA